MRILGSVALPVLFDGDARVRDVELRVVDGLPYGFIVEADFFRRNASVLDFSSNRGFRPVPAAPWVPFRLTAPYAPHAASPLCNTRDQFSLLTAAPETAPEVPVVPTDVPSYEDVVWEDDISFEWDVRQMPETTVVEGFTTRAVEAAAVGPQPRDRQLVMVLPIERFDLEQGAVVGVARGVMWWVPGSPVYCKLVNSSKEKVAVEGSRVIARMVAATSRLSIRCLMSRLPLPTHPFFPMNRAPRARPQPIRNLSRVFASRTPTWRR